jgi:hypothetical protein
MMSDSTHEASEPLPVSPALAAAIALPPPEPGSVPARSGSPRSRSSSASRRRRPWVLLRLIGLITNLVFFHRLGTELLPPGAARPGPWVVLIPVAARW